MADVGRPDGLVGEPVADRGDDPAGRREEGGTEDVVAGQVGPSREVGVAVDDLHDVQGVTLRRGDVVVVDQLGVPALTDVPPVGKW